MFPSSDLSASLRRYTSSLLHLAGGAAAVALASWAAMTHAAEVRVLSPSAMHSSLELLVAAYGKQSKDDIRLTFETAPAMTKKLAAGEIADVIISPPATMDRVVEMGKANPAGRFELGRVGV